MFVRIFYALAIVLFIGFYHFFSQFLVYVCIFIICKYVDLYVNGIYFTYKFRLDTRRAFEDGTYPIKVNIHNRKTNTNRDLTFYKRANRLSATKRIIKLSGLTDSSIIVLERLQGGGF